MKGYLIITGHLSTTAEMGYKPTILGIVDPTNYRNTISLKDILTNKRIARTVYNLGLRLTATGYPIMDTIQYLGVTYEFRESINTSVFTEVSIPADAWDMGPDDITEDTIELFRKELRNTCPEFDDAAMNFVITKLTSDAYNILLGQYTATSGGGEAEEYYLQEGTMNGEAVKNVSILYPRAAGELIMYSPTDDIPFVVPSFYDLVSYKKYEEALVNKDLQSTADLDEPTCDDDDSMEKSISETSFFSQKDLVYTDIYLPYNSYPARTKVISENGIEIPIINPTSVKVQKVTQFWEVNPASVIPEAAYGRKDDGTAYGINDLIGHPENNHLELQPNERRYYNELKELLEVCCSIEHNALSDEVYQQNSDRYSEVLEEYLKTMSEQAFNLMWCHTGTTQSVYPEGANADDDDDFSDESGTIIVEYKLHCHCGTVLPDGKGFRYQPFYQNMGLGSDAAIRTELKAKLPRLYLGFDGSEEGGFVHHEGALVGFVQQNPSNLRWIDTLIRLLRWGERKQCMLSWEPLDGTSADTTKYWNLNTASVSTHDGNIDNYLPVNDEQTGNPYNIIAVVCADINVPKGAYEQAYGPSGFEGGVISVHVPIGVKLQVNYAEEGVHKIVYEDIFTYHDKIRSTSPDDRRGHIVFDGENYIDVSNEYGTLIPEEPLFRAVQSLEMKSYSERVDGKDLLFVFRANSNCEITEKRNEIYSHFTDVAAAIAFKNSAATKNIFNSIQMFCTMAAQANCLIVGKRFAETLSATGSLGINPENARIVYTFLDRLVRLAYTSVPAEGTTACDLATVLKTIDSKPTNNTKEESTAVDPCWEDFQKFIDVQPTDFIFCEMMTPAGPLPAVFGLKRDKSAKQFLFLSADEFKQLKAKYPNLICKNIQYEDKYKQAFTKAVIAWNASGKNFTNCKHANMVMSSNAAMKIISDLLV